MLGYRAVEAGTASARRTPVVLVVMDDDVVAEEEMTVAVVGLGLGK
jgi:hypothetical protein